MEKLIFKKELYSKTALIKAAYNFIDRAYIHLDSDDENYYVLLERKKDVEEVSKKEFINEMLAQSARHEVYLQTKDIRKLMLARAMATSVVVDKEISENVETASFSEDEVLKDWFDSNENS